MTSKPLVEGLTELRLLGVAVVIGLLQLAWAASHQNEPQAIYGAAARLRRAMANFLETFPLFAAALLAAVALGRTGATTLSGAWLYVVARALYVPLYALNLTILRSLAWFAALIGIVLELLALLGPLH